MKMRSTSGGTARKKSTSAATAKRRPAGPGEERDAKAADEAERDDDRADEQRRQQPAPDDRPGPDHDLNIEELVEQRVHQARLQAKRVSSQRPRSTTGTNSTT